MASFNIKTNRTFTAIRKYGWIFTLTVAFGGLWYPKLGLLVIPVILSLMIMSLFKGRYWCGNFCAHGSLFDFFMMPLSRNVKIPAFFKSKIVGAVFLIWFGFNLVRRIVKVTGLLGTMAFWDQLGFVFVASYLMVTIVGGFLSLLVAPRTWCNVCPMGLMQSISYRLGQWIGVTRKTDQKISIADTDKCHQCAKCARVCPMQLTPYLEFSGKNQFDNDLCIRCSTCVVNCPAAILSLGKEESACKVKSD